MPCQSYPPSGDEVESRRLYELMNEVFGRMTTQPANLTRRQLNDWMTQALCNWSKTHDVTKQSLELQIWWRDHQRRDAQRVADEEAAARRLELKARARAKLTAEELEALLGN